MFPLQARCDPRVGRVIALLFQDRGTSSSTPRPHFTPGKDPVPILQEAGWAPGPVWTGEKSRPHRDSIPDRPALSQSLYRLSYRAHTSTHTIPDHIYRTVLCQFRSVTRLICPDVATLLVLAFLYLNHPTVNLSTYQLFLTDDFVY